MQPIVNEHTFYNLREEDKRQEQKRHCSQATQGDEVIFHSHISEGGHIKAGHNFKLRFYLIVFRIIIYIIILPSYV